jgi:hypothetical protein
MGKTAGDENIHSSLLLLCLRQRDVTFCFLSKEEGKLLSFLHPASLHGGVSVYSPKYEESEKRKTQRGAKPAPPLLSDLFPGQIDIFQKQKPRNDSRQQKTHLSEKTIK